MASSNKIKKTSSFWDENVKFHEKPFVPLSWLDSPIVQSHCLNKLRAGEKVISIIQWILWVKEGLLPSTVLDYGLSLGCGDGTLERQAVALKICSKFDAFDISTKSIEAAKRQCEEQGLSDLITYHVADLNNITLPPGKYDIVFSGMAMHHLSNLEHVFAELRKSLKPDGILLLMEFVGPTQFQWTDKQLQFINDILSILPERFKIDRRTGSSKEQCLRPTLRYMNEHDPSEAIRSGDIIPLVYKMWDVVQRIDFGGTISHLLLDGIAANFDPAKEEDVAILKLISYIDDILIKEGVLPSDFTLIVAKDKAFSYGKSLYAGEKKPFPAISPIGAGKEDGLFQKFTSSLKENGYRRTAQKIIAYIRKRL